MCRRCVRLSQLLFILVYYVAKVAATMVLHYNVTEEVPAQFKVGNVVTDAGLRQELGDVIHQLRFRFISRPVLQTRYLKISETTGDMWTVNVIDRELLCPNSDLCELNYDIAVSPRRFFRLIKCKIQIVDRNDHAPRFAQTSLKHKLVETASPGASLPLPLAQDPDAGENSVRLYKLEPGSDVFALHYIHMADGTTDLRLELKKHLDRERVDHYDFRLMAYDGGHPQRSGSMRIAIAVEDINDNRCRFSNKTYSVHIRENMPLLTNIFRVSASDGDVGKAGQISYGLSRVTLATNGDFFGINPKTGDIFLKQRLNYEHTQSYSLTVTCKDQGEDSLTDEASVIVRLVDMNDMAPDIKISTISLNSGEAQIKENSPNGTFIAHLKVTDRDTGLNSRFRCDLNRPRRKFKLKQLSVSDYRLSSAVVFDREKTEKYEVSITCTDYGEPPLRTTRLLTVRILDENDSLPVCSKNVYNVSMKENNRPGATVLRVDCRDADSDLNGRVSYEIAGEHADWFMIDARTGVLSVKGSLDFEAKQRINVTLIASDREGEEPCQSAQASIIINVIDTYDEIPRFPDGPMSFRVRENLTAGTVVGQVQAFESDGSPAEVHYVFAKPSHATLQFRLGRRTGVVSTREKLDYEKIQLYALDVLAISDVNPLVSCLKTFTILVDDYNDNVPYFVFPTKQDHVIIASIHAPAQHKLGHILGADFDSYENGKVTYAIGDGDDEQLFILEKITGKLKTGKYLSAAKKTKYTLNITLADRGSPPLSTFANLVIKIADIPLENGEEVVHGDSRILVFITIISALLLLVCGGLLTWLRCSYMRRRGREQRMLKEEEKMMDSNRPNGDCVPMVDTPAHLTHVIEEEDLSDHMDEDLDEYDDDEFNEVDDDDDDDLAINDEEEAGRKNSMPLNKFTNRPQIPDYSSAV